MSEPPSSFLRVENGASRRGAVSLLQGTLCPRLPAKPTWRPHGKIDAFDPNETCGVLKFRRASSLEAKSTAMTVKSNRKQEILFSSEQTKKAGIAANTPVREEATQLKIKRGRLRVSLQPVLFPALCAQPLIRRVTAL